MCELMTLRECADVLGISINTMYATVHRKTHPLPHVRIGKNAIKVRRETLDKWLSEEERRCDR